MPAPDSREEKNSLAFLDNLAGLGGYTLRPLSYLSLEQMGLLEMSFAKGKEDWKALDELERLDELNAFLYLQSAEIPKISRAIRAFRVALRSTSRPAAWESFICDHVEPFLATLAPEAKAGLVDQLERLDEIDAARVNAAPPAGSPSQERHDPNS